MIAEGTELGDHRTQRDGCCDPLAARGASAVGNKPLTGQWLALQVDPGRTAMKDTVRAMSVGTKSAAEIEAMRVAGRLAAEVLDMNG